MAAVEAGSSNSRYLGGERYRARAVRREASWTALLEGVAEFLSTSARERGVPALAGLPARRAPRRAPAGPDPVVLDRRRARATPAQAGVSVSSHEPGVVVADAVEQGA